MGINAHIPRTSRFVIGVRASTRHIGASLRIPDGLRVTFTPQTFVKEVIHATGQADIFGHVPGRAQANNTVWADRLLICSGNGVTLIIIFLRLLNSTGDGFRSACPRRLRERRRCDLSFTRAVAFCAALYCALRRVSLYARI